MVSLCSHLFKTMILEVKYLILNVHKLHGQFLNVFVKVCSLTLKWSRKKFYENYDYPAGYG